MKVYVSSTMADLGEYRRAIFTTLRKLGHIPVGMEDGVAEPEGPLDVCRDDVRSCDAYIGIVAWRYGFVPTRQRHSITSSSTGQRANQESPAWCSS